MLDENSTAGSLRPRPNWGMNISQELQEGYLRQISQYPILTVEEELRWAKQHCENKQALQELMRGFPMLLIAVTESLRQNVATIRISNFFTLSESSFNDDDKNVRDAFNEACLHLEEIRECYRRGDKVAGDSMLRDAFSSVIPRDEFYNACVERLSGDEKRSVFIGRQSWKALKQKICRYADSMREAADKLIEHNLRLVLSIAGRYGVSSIPFADLVQEGNIGLMRAVERFNYKLGHRFTTYASYWIRQSISKYLAKHGRIIRMPANTIAMISSIRQVEQRILMDTGEIPSADEIAKELGVSATKIRALQRMTQQPISLQSAVDEDSTLEENIADTHSASPDEILDGQSMRNALYEAMKELDEREQRILKLRFGLEDEKPMKLADVSALIGVSSERVRQIENKALGKIRSSMTVNSLLSNDDND
ncbi:MAG: sigma-70 family RNA polymerase sigma factor [Victivallales bacterium]|nr:sigma-70 family RNA polymerase sigma factor [Victivallales bacterium]